jgi:hypothetical protein
MSGPAYPPNPTSGANAIGLYEVGVSPIGDIPPFNVWDTVESQFANSPIITALIQQWDAALDQTENLSGFFDNIWNVDTAYGYGLDVWGRIVGLPNGRTVSIIGGTFFGFQESGAAVGFGQGQFYNGVPLTLNYQLNDLQFRRLILAKALANISNGSIQSINRILLTLFFGRGVCYVQDGVSPQTYFGFQESGTALGFGQGAFYSSENVAEMRMTYVFHFELTPIDYAIMNAGVLPKPLGVQSSILIV